MTEETWTDAKNNRRCKLINKKYKTSIHGVLPPDEEAELESLQKEVEEYVNRVAPLPLRETKALLDSLCVSIIRSSMTGEKSLLWEDVSAKMSELADRRSFSIDDEELDDETKKFLIEVLAFEGKLSLDKNSSFPHRAAPEVLFKSFAAQILTKCAKTEEEKLLYKEYLK